MYVFDPILKPVIWGGDRIGALKHIDNCPACTGESWEISGVPGNETVVAQGPEKGTTLSALIDKHREALVGRKAWDEHGTRFPLLIKFIDARADLSVQVHPDDRLARERHQSPGKTEMWYILDTDPDARIYCGLKSPLNPELYTSMVRDNSIMNAIAAYPSSPGDVFFLPAGRIHAIGAGNLLAEIQQTSDITYRIYDYDRRDANGNPRQLHTDLAREAIDYTVYPEYRTQYDRKAPDAKLAECSHFTVRRIVVDGDTELQVPADSFTILICIDGECTVDDGISVSTLTAYHTALIPASAKRIECQGKATLLTATL